MITKCSLLTAAAAALLASGCSTMEVGTQRPLGNVQYAAAFDAARTVMGHYFTVALADTDSGVILSTPRPMAGGVLAGGPLRQTARVRICRAEGGVVAYATVNVQRQSSVAMQQMARGDLTDDKPPYQTPAQLEGATTPQQNDLWLTERRDRELEFKILNDIQNALHPNAKN
ncbi:MAG: hypothetical protein ABSH10_08210 [Phycisphaerae bacterium]|jgi:hypothetical protein